MPGRLRDHLLETRDTDSFPFVLSVLNEKAPRGATCVETIAALILRSKSDPQVLEDLVRAAGWDVALAVHHNARPAVKRGDFGEMITTESVEDFDGWEVPVRKLRYQIDPNQTLPGADVVAFVRDGDGEVLGLTFLESKYRKDPPRDLAIVAHDQLAADRERSFATTLNFMANRLAELNEPLYASFIRYIGSGEARQDSYGVALICDRARWSDEIIHDLAGESELLEPLLLRVAQFDELTQLVDAVYEALAWKALDDDEQ